MFKKIFPLLLLLTVTVAQAQIILTDPIFPRQTDTVTITYDAAAGNAALSGITPVYGHMGLITNLSTGPSDWKYVQGNWGTADPNTLMTPIGNDKHEITVHIPTFYGVPGSETVEQLSFVFRTANGNIVGREADGGDIYYDVYGPGLHTRFVQPAGNQLVNLGDTLDIWGAASDSAALSLFDNGSQIATANGTDLMHQLVVTTGGNHTLILVADDGSVTKQDTIVYVVNPNNPQVNPPSGSELGINYVNDSTVRLVLYAPGKDNVFVIGDFNNYQLDVDYAMTLAPDNATWWVEFSGLTPGQNYTFQYLVDGNLRVADPYSELILDPWNDSFIDAATYPNMPVYPNGKTTDIVSVLEPGKPAYNWQNPTYVLPDQEDLVIYELLVRDFVDAHNYTTLLDSLDYLSDLGVNVIELMPVNEFEGNISWGYNPSYHMALDKYYGTEEQLKAFIDECHGRGIAVVLDVVYNHAFSQSPLCRLYWDDANFRPSADNPWLNVTAKHDFNVGYDFNHDSPATEAWVDRVMEYWINDYKVDGFRFDLSKGFTQNNSVGNVGLWGQYDQSRIDNLKRVADVCWNSNPNFYVILEHFADNNEEEELSDYGMMLWGNINHQYGQASMGYSTDFDFTWVSYQARGWSDPNVIGYMESHDEERLMYKNLQFGNAGSGYDITTLPVALDRMELSGALFYTVPGPKMLWQFGEVGYDFSINFGGSNVDPKPIRWDYFADADRQYLYKVWSALIHLKQDYPAFSTTNYTTNFGGVGKTLHLYDNSMNVVVLGNFGVSQTSVNPDFPSIGKWYEYFTGDSISVLNATDQLSLAAGEYRIYTDQRLPAPDLTIVGQEEDLRPDALRMSLWPNPSTGLATVSWVQDLPGTTEVRVLDLTGRVVLGLPAAHRNAGAQNLRLDLSELNAGVYLVEINAGGKSGVQKMVLRK